MEELMEILEDICPDVEFKGEDGLIDKKLLSSFDVLSIVGELNDTFGIQIGAGEIIPKNFNSAQAMWDMVTRLKGA